MMGLFRQSPKLTVVYITYIAVVRSIQNNGLGKILLSDALRRAHDLTATIGFSGVALRSLNDDTTRFYARAGFAPIYGNQHPLMLLPIQSLIDLFSANTPSTLD